MLSMLLTDNARLAAGTCVQLVAEGRAALATSLACYKFLIMYGEILTFTGFISYYFTITPPQWWCV
jgi:cation-transporting ATPase 13A3/4/5